MVLFQSTFKRQFEITIIIILIYIKRFKKVSKYKMKMMIKNKILDIIFINILRLLENNY